MAHAGKGWVAALGQLIWRNGITLFGSSLTTVSTVAIAVFFGLGVLGMPMSPYIGILAYLMLPALFLFGLFLIPLGAYIERRRRRGMAQHAMAHIQLDFNSPRLRKLAVIVGFLTLANIMIVSALSYEGAVYMESVQFCGETCHTVMEPEFKAHMDSPHARVKCVDCHIGPGLPSLIHAKLNGLNQVYGVLTNSHDRPVPTPVHDLAHAELTCGECHNPEKDLGDVFKVVTEYGEDDANTPLQSVLLMHVGGRGATTPGIHTWHMNPGREIYYLATDETRETISYVTVHEADGTSIEYLADGADPEAPRPDLDSLRRMDCTDCHNRASHQFEMPGPALNAALAEGRIDPTLPAIKTAGLNALEAAVDADDGPAFIATEVNQFYADNHAAIVADRKDILDTAIAELQSIYQRNIFPKMNIGWGTYPDHIGHTQSNGCFRCHDDGHRSVDGQHVISQDCTVCHNVIAWQEENPAILESLGIQ